MTNHALGSCWHHTAYRASQLHNVWQRSTSRPKTFYLFLGRLFQHLHATVKRSQVSWYPLACLMESLGLRGAYLFMVHDASRNWLGNRQCSGQEPTCNREMVSGGTPDLSLSPHNEGKISCVFEQVLTSTTLKTLTRSSTTSTETIRQALTITQTSIPSSSQSFSESSTSSTETSNTSLTVVAGSLLGGIESNTPDSSPTAAVTAGTETNPLFQESSASSRSSFLPTITVVSTITLMHTMASCSLCL